MQSRVIIICLLSIVAVIVAMYLFINQHDEQQAYSPTKPSEHGAALYMVKVQTPYGYQVEVFR